ncbi:MAG TPA: hypothetical protein DCL61_17935 [Cyanobacteria bacterium UBA12227]|nr:hypothetical protein [Cyanobacteria bacterium UBA12227]HAX87081.1 hypothetical protein [Cyanobacteria bacterium UBA11370]HBY78725.1 hypothetical protein [Cyanobacteria bacterium UBA11148]
MELEEYEFTRRDNKLILHLSKDMRFVGIFLKVGGCMSVFGSFLTGWLDGDWAFSCWGILTGIISLVLGLRALDAATSFKDIAVHKGDDMKNLMKGFEQVKRLYRFELLGFITNIILFIIILVTIFSFQ